MGNFGVLREFTITISTFSHILEYKRRPLKWLIDITIGYPENKTLNLQTIMMGTRKPCMTTMHYRKFPVEDIPFKSDALTQWLYKRFEEKEEMLDFFYKTGQFPMWDLDKCKVDTNLVSKPRFVRFPDEKIIAIYFLYLVAGYFTCYQCVSPVLGLIGTTPSLVGLF